LVRGWSRGGGAPALAPVAESAPVVATEVVTTAGGGAAGAGLGASLGVGACGLVLGALIGRGIGNLPVIGGGTVDDFWQQAMVEYIWRPDRGPSTWPPTAGRCLPQTQTPTLGKGGKQNKRDTGLEKVSDADVSKRARDKSLPPAERRRYQREDKARGNRNKQKRQ
jgi:hypothetical protein